MKRIINSIYEIPAVADGSLKIKSRNEYFPSPDELEPAEGSDEKSKKCTELRYADLLDEKLPDIKTVGAQWLLYKVGAWNPVTKDIFIPQALDTLPTTLRTAKQAKAILEHLEGRYQVPEDKLIGCYCFDANGAVLINTHNVVLRVTAEKIDCLPHSANYGFTRQIVAQYHPATTAPLFNKTCKQALPDPNDRQLLQLLAGNLLLPDCRHEVATVCYGPGGSGKSTIADQFSTVLGPTLVKSLSMGLICDPKTYHLSELQFAAVNLGTELDTIALDESANFKAVVSGESIAVRPIYGKPKTMRTSAKLFFLANGLPRFKNGTDAELRRMRFLHFNQVPEKKDVMLKSKLAVERDGIFNFMLAGLQMVLAVPEISIGGEAAAKVHNRFRISNDPVGAFVADHCRLDAAARQSKEGISNAFEEFRQTHAIMLEVGWFYRKLYERFPDLKEIQHRDGSRRIRSIQGLTLKDRLGID